MKAQTTPTKIITTGVFLVLILTGTTIYTLSADDLSKAYICEATNITTIFDRTSSTNVTGYYTVNGTQKSAVCKPKWIKLTQWCLNNKIDCNEFVKSGFPTDEKTIPLDTFDESGAVIIRTTAITIDKDTSINVNGTIINITYKATEPGVVCVKADKTPLKVSDIVSCWNNK